jgi:hypothetical protein
MFHIINELREKFITFIASKIPILITIISIYY